MVAIASDVDVVGARLPVAKLDDAEAIADFMLEYAVDAGSLFGLMHAGSV